MTMRGFDEDDSREVGRIICAALADDPDLAALAARSGDALRAPPALPGFAGYTTYVGDGS